MDSTLLCRPQTQKYWRVIAYLLEPFGVGSQTWWGLPTQPKIFKIIHYVITIFLPLSVILQILKLYIHFKDYSFFEIGNIITAIMIDLLCNLKLACSQRSSYKRIMKDFMSGIHIFYYKPKTAFTNKILLKAERYGRITSCLVIIFMLAASLYWALSPLIFNILYAVNSNGTIRYRAVIYMLLPFDYERNFKNWLIMYIVSIYGTVLCVLLYIIVDVIFYTIIFHLIGRIEILKYHLRVLTTSFKNLTNDDIHKKLATCVRDHVTIKRHFKDLQDAFGLSVTGNYFVNLVVDSLLLLEFKYGDTSIKAAYSFVVLNYACNLILLTTVIEAIRIKFSELPDAVYAVPWECMTVPQRKIILVLLAQVQPDVVFTAFGGLEAGIKPTISIIKSTFSYYVMLKEKRTA